MRLTASVCSMFLIVLSIAGATRAESEDADIFQAARDGDLATIVRLLDQGVDVNSATRYGATALTFATEKGHVEVVEALLERGADPNVRDSFYHQTPLGWAGARAELVVPLLEHGAEDIASALVVAVQNQNLEVVNKILEVASPLPTYLRNYTLQQAKGLEADDIAERLASAEVTNELKEVKLDPARLRSFARRYETGDGPDQPAEKRTLVTELIDEHRLKLRLDGGEPMTLVSVGGGAFRSLEEPDLGFQFFGRGTSVEGVFMIEGPTSGVRFAPADATADVAQSDVASSAAKPAAAKPAAAKRTADRPWPGFRGAEAAGNGDGQGAVTTWDVESGRNVRWSTEIPGLGLSSPIVWGDRIFLTTAVSAKGNHSLRTGLYGDFDMAADDSKHSWQVLALDAASGEIVWQKTAGEAVPTTGRHEKSSQANSTPVTDGERVVAVFPTVGMFCYDFDGKLLWHVPLGDLNAGWFYDRSYEWGFASSPIIDQGRVILQVDVHEGAYIAAFDLADGRQLWRSERDEIPTWATPNVYRRGERAELIVNGTTIRGYDPESGKQLWSLAPNSEVIIATPIFTDDLIYVTAGYPPARMIYAVKPGSRGDLSLAADASQSEHIAWSHDRGGAYMPTPILYRGLFYIGHHDARMVAYDAATGERVYRARFSQGGTFTGSPVAADGHLYFATEDGDIYVVAAGPEYREVAVNNMGEPVMATPAISAGSLLVRTASRLYALGETETARSQ